MERIYFDNGATTAPYPAVLAAMTETAQGFYGNPSSLHSEGQAAQKLLDSTRVGAEVKAEIRARRADRKKSQ